MENKIINIDHQLMRDSTSTMYIQTTKTSAGTRKLPITDEVAACFRSIIKDRPKVEFEKMIDGDIGFLYIDEKGIPLAACYMDEEDERIEICIDEMLEEYWE